MRAPDGDDDPVAERARCRLKFPPVEIQHSEELGAFVNLGPDPHRVCQESWRLSTYPLRIADGDELAQARRGNVREHVEPSKNSKQTGRCLIHMTEPLDFTNVQ
jgi:hypothetical protein